MRIVDPIGREAARVDIFARGVDGGQPVLCREFDDGVLVREHHRLGIDEQRVGVLLERRVEGAAELCAVAHIENDHLQPERLARALDLAPLLGRGRIAEVERRGDALRLRGKLLQQLQALACDFAERRAEPGHVAARVREAAHDAVGDRIGRGGHDDRNRAGFHGGERGRRAARKDHIGLRARELGRERRKAVPLAVRRAVVENEVLALDVAGLAHALPERLQVRQVVGLRRHVEDADAIDLARLGTRAEGK